MEMFGKRLTFSHYPLPDDGWFDFNYHGHLHDFGLERVKEVEPEVYAVLTPKHRLVSMEKLNY